MLHTALLCGRPHEVGPREVGLHEMGLHEVRLYEAGETTSVLRWGYLSISALRLSVSGG